MDNTSSWMQCYGDFECIPFNPLNPDIESINIVTIAHSLANQCRFNGHTKEFFSVAQHSVFVSNLCDEKDALWGLLHDASEAYLTDIPRPLKRSDIFSGYGLIEKRLMHLVCAKFALPFDMPASVKEADEMMLARERRDLMQPGCQAIWSHTPTVPDDVPHLHPVAPQEAKRLFLDRFRSIVSGSTEVGTTNG